MVAGGTDLGSLLADDDMAAVAALPDDITLARKDHRILDVLQQLAIAFLVMFLDGAYEFKLRIKEPSRDSAPYRSFRSYVVLLYFYNVFIPALFLWSMNP